jgi:streptogramin lyase
LAIATPGLPAAQASGVAGKVTEFSAGNTVSETFGNAAGPDGNLWFTKQGANEVARITPAGVVNVALNRAAGH